MIRNTLLLLGMTGAVCICGCPDAPPSPPHSMLQYQELRQTHPDAYPPYVVVQINLQRVLDDRLSEAERAESLNVVTRLGAENPEALSELAGVLSQEHLPEQLQRAVLTFLLKKDFPVLAGAVVKALPDIKPGSGMRDAILDWLSRHGDMEVLSEVVKQWAQEPSVSGPNEARFRQIVERISGKAWDEALLTGLNAEGAFARGSALDVLGRRIATPALRKRIGALRPNSEAVRILHEMIQRFDYLPTTRAELVACAAAYKTQRQLLRESASLFARWQADYGYRFNIRDFHLLGRITQDPLRDRLGRTHLRLQLSESTLERKHPPTRPVAGAAATTDRYEEQVNHLSMSDLWRLYLLSEMLSRERVQIALRIMAERDREDTTRPWGGLVFYENGRAEAKLYPARSGDDAVYAPTDRALIDGRDALCVFHAHFEKADNTGRTGPDAAELRRAAAGNTNALVLTSLSDDEFCAHFYTPTGWVVSLGIFPLRK
jgi:hypothetical protein